jgi:hypothetical protein
VSGKNQQLFLYIPGKKGKAGGGNPLRGDTRPSKKVKIPNGEQKSRDFTGKRNKLLDFVLRHHAVRKDFCIYFFLSFYSPVRQAPVIDLRPKIPARTNRSGDKED